MFGAAFKVERSLAAPIARAPPLPRAARFAAMQSGESIYALIPPPEVAEERPPMHRSQHVGAVDPRDFGMPPKRANATLFQETAAYAAQHGRAAEQPEKENPLEPLAARNNVVVAASSGNRARDAPLGGANRGALVRDRGEGHGSGDGSHFGYCRRVVAAKRVRR